MTFKLTFLLLLPLTGCALLGVMLPDSKIEVQTDFTTSAKPAEAMRVLADFESIPKWNQTVLSVQKQFAGDLAVGARFDELRKELIGSKNMGFVVTQWERDTLLTVHGENETTKIDFSFQVQRLAKGSSVRLIYTETPANGLLVYALRPIYKLAIARNMQRLQTLIDG